MQIINEKEFVIAALNLTKKTFMIHMAYLGAKILIYLAQKFQITLLITEKVIVLAKYFDFVEIFSKKLVMKLLK